MKVRLTANSFINDTYRRTGEVVEVPDGTTGVHFEAYEEPKILPPFKSEVQLSPAQLEAQQKAAQETKAVKKPTTKPDNIIRPPEPK